MPGIVMNVGPSMAGSGSGGGTSAGGGQTLGNAQGSITINVRNVTQAKTILQQSSQQMAKAFGDIGKAAQQASRVQIAASNATAAQHRADVARMRAESQALALSSQEVISSTKEQIESQNLLTATYRAQIAQIRARSAAVTEATRSQKEFSRAINAAASESDANFRSAKSQMRSTSQEIKDIVESARQSDLSVIVPPQQALSKWQSILGSVRELRTEILAIGAGAGILTGLGFQYAGFLQEANIQLEAMTGSQEKASMLMTDLRDKGRQARIPMREMLTFATQLLPVLEKDTNELDRWFDIVRRTAVLNRGPMGGLQGAAFSLREAFLSVQQGGRDFVSLADRFNISKVALREALEISGGDFIAAIDMVLDRMGITVEMADRMANSFNAGLTLARDAALQLLGEGFGPLLRVIGPLLQGAADFMATVAQTNPEVLVLGAALLSLVTVGSGVILMLERMTVAWAVLGATAQASIARMAGLAGLAVVATAGARPVGSFIGNRIRELTGREPLSKEDQQEQLLTRRWEFVVQIADAAQQFVQAIYSMESAMLDFRAIIYDAISGIASAIASITFGSFSDDLEEVSRSAARQASSSRFQASQTRQRGRDARAGIYDWAINVGRSMGAPGFESEGVGIDSGAEAINVKRVEAQLKFLRSVEDLERDSQRQRFSAERQYSEQVSTLTENYNKSRLREAEDFARQRMRQEQQLAEDILEVREDATRREAEWLEDFNLARRKEEDKFREDREERLEDHQEKLADLEEDFQDKRRKDLRSHQDKLLDAAGNLDARAILEEQRRFARQEKDRKEDFDKRVREEKENFDKRKKREEEDFDERLRSEEESLQRRIDKAREADERRIQEMEEDLRDQQRIEDEDRAIRLQRQEDDFQDQLEQLASQHSLRMQEINRQEADRLQSLKDSLDDELNQLGLYHSAREIADKIFYDKSLERWGNFFDDWIDREKSLRQQARLQDPIPSGIKPDDPLIPFQSGGPVRRNTKAVLHKGEYVLNPNTTRILQDMLAGGRTFTQRGLVSSIANSTSNRSSSVSVSEGAIQIFATESQSPMDIAVEVRQQFISIMREIKGE